MKTIKKYSVVLNPRWGDVYIPPEEVVKVKDVLGLIKELRKENCTDIALELKEMIEG